MVGQASFHTAWGMGPSTRERSNDRPGAGASDMGVQDRRGGPLIQGLGPWTTLSTPGLAPVQDLPDLAQELLGHEGLLQEVGARLDGITMDRHAIGVA